WVIALVSLTTRVLWSWRLGTSKTGERRYLIDLLETLPQAVLKSVLLVCGAGYVGYDLFGHLLKQECSFLIRLSSQAQLYSLEMVEVQGFTEGEFWYWTDDAEQKSKPPLRVLKLRFLTPPRDQITARYSLGCDCRSCLASTFRPVGVSIFSASSFSSRCSASCRTARANP